VRKKNGEMDLNEVEMLFTKIGIFLYWEETTFLSRHDENKG